MYPTRSDGMTNIYTIVGTLLMLAQCSGAVCAQDSPERAAQLAGQWVSAACEAASPAAERSLRRSFQLSDWAWRADVALYDGAACSRPLVGIRIEGTYLVTRESVTVPLSSEATFFYTRKSAAALSEIGAQLLTASKCGAAPWRVGLEQDISETGCLGFPAIRQSCLQEFDIVSMAESALRFGARNPNMCIESGRPKQLSPFPLVRVH
jgi:hypothetical protein